MKRSLLPLLLSACLLVLALAGCGPGGAAATDTPAPPHQGE